MRIFDYSKLKFQTWDSETVSLIAQIYQQKGKQEVYLQQQPQELETLVEIAKIQSTEASNAIEGIRTTDSRLKQLVRESIAPHNRAEAEIAGYRDALNTIHLYFDAIPITPNFILQLHKILMGQVNVAYGGKFKNVQNYISATDNNGNSFTLFTPLSPFETPAAVEMLCEAYNRALGSGIEPLVLIPIFIHDFLCIHPFTDGNGRMSRLLTTLLLYRSGFYVGRFISLEAEISRHKDLYYDALQASQEGWHDNKENALPFVKYLLSTVLAAYGKFEERMQIIASKLPAKEMVLKAVQTKIGRLTKQDIRELCPTLSISSVESAMRALIADGVIERYGTGRTTYYIRKK